jgi:hypothetical protein
MAQLLQGTFFGHFLHFASGGKLLPFEEQKNPSLLKQFSVESQSAENGTPGYGNNAENAEKGKDVQLVGWNGHG